MWIERVKRWQWLLLGAAVGSLLWWSWRPDTDSLAGYGECMNDSRAFEAALVGAGHGAPRFTNVRVHRQSVDDGAGSAAEVYVVSGDYCDGNPDPLDGTLHWRPRYLLAPAPYRPHWNLYDFGGAPGGAAGGAAKALEEYQRIKSPTVEDFLRLLRTAGVVSYTNAWWRTYPAATWVGGSVLVIGVVWPTVINLLAFGRLTRPREEKGIDLSQVKNPAAPAPAGPSADDLEQLHELEAELEAKLAGAAPAPPAEQPAGPPRRAAVLTTAPAGPAPDAPHVDTVFGAKADDFYPTERHADHPHPHPPARP